nr:MAG TPA: hypothetical protein [Caudoviricetes sp.]
MATPFQPFIAFRKLSKCNKAIVSNIYAVVYKAKQRRRHDI